MDNPPQEIEKVIRLLTQSPPSVQRATVEKYFTRDAEFTHPFCRTWSFDGSRYLIMGIYQWYKIMSPKIQLEVHSIAYDAQNLILYVQLSQIFSIWAIPFHSSHVRLTTVLNLTKSEETNKYYLTSQNDLYQVDQFVRFAWFGGFLFVWIWQTIATIACLIGTLLFAPLLWSEDRGGLFNKIAERLQSNQVNGIEEDDSKKESKGHSGLVEQPKGSGNFITAPALEQR